jgi:hypothetical protein
MACCRANFYQKWKTVVHYKRITERSMTMGWTSRVPPPAEGKIFFLETPTDDYALLAKEKKVLQGMTAILP